MDTVTETEIEPLPPVKRQGLISRIQVAVLAVLAGTVLFTPGSLKYKLDFISFGVCHQLTSHSFYIAGHQCPLCARCTGIYIGAGVTLLMQKFLRPYASRLPARNVLPWLAMMFASMVLDGVNSTFQDIPGAFTPYETTNVIRVITGALAGVSMMFILTPIFNQTFWKPQLLNKERSMDSVSELVGYLVPVGVIVAIILSANNDPNIGEWLYWPVALLSIFGLLAMLVMASVLVVSTITKRSGTIFTWRAAFAPMLVALFLSLTFLILFAYGRIELTSIAGVPALSGFPLTPGLP